MSIFLKSLISVAGNAKIIYPKISKNTQIRHFGSQIKAFSFFHFFKYDNGFFEFQPGNIQKSIFCREYKYCFIFAPNFAY